RRRRGDWLAVDMALARDNRGLVGDRRDETGAQVYESEGPLHIDRCGPRAVPLGERYIFEHGAAEPSARGEKRNGFENIRLARAVQSDEHDRTGAHLDLFSAIAPEIGQPQ